MAYFLNHLHTLFTFVAFFSLSTIQSTFGWSSTVATWYGAPNGAGNDGGGACGYGPVAVQPPYSKMVSAAGSSLFQSGTGCGVCYQVKCNSNPACSGNPITVTITDQCPGTCGPLQFDLSGVAFGAMAISGKADVLRHAGRLQIEYQRVQCHYHGVTIAFHVDEKSNPYYFATAVVYEGGDGNLAKVELQNSGQWLPMQHSWGAVWKLNSASKLVGPLSIRLTTLSFHKTLIAKNVIPTGWSAGQTYRSNVNFG